MSVFFTCQEQIWLNSCCITDSGCLGHEFMLVKALYYALTYILLLFPNLLLCSWRTNLCTPFIVHQLSCVLWIPNLMYRYVHFFKIITMLHNFKCPSIESCNRDCLNLCIVIWYSSKLCVKKTLVLLSSECCTFG